MVRLLHKNRKGGFISTYNAGVWKAYKILFRWHRLVVSHRFQPIDSHGFIQKTPSDSPPPVLQMFCTEVMVDRTEYENRQSPNNPGIHPVFIPLIHAAISTISVNTICRAICCMPHPNAYVQHDGPMGRALGSRLRSPGVKRLSFWAPTVSVSYSHNTQFLLVQQVKTINKHDIQ